MKAGIFANDGGPLIVLDADDARFWKGGTSGAPWAPMDSDYERACRAGHPASLVPVEMTLAIVIGAQEGIAEAEWRPIPDDGSVLLVGSVFGDEQADQELVAALRREEESRWTALGDVNVGSGKLLLFHAASAGAEVRIDPEGEFALIGDGLTKSVPVGRYAVAACEISWPDKALYNVVRWVRQS